ncbi:hypothetical protein D9613_010517 [Agrocybe pediades]|uniref:DNA replication ATP-dependent helicase/nuclease DNA2 n=1 Tax=Agrocybe pediades TaxID=84607 RepID=A0A8H4QGF7_9AGAR|nr:hypothetical protein D9613_010517 [Agrocybe pediades]
MAGKTRSAEEEAAFMRDLIQGLGDDFWDAAPSSPPPLPPAPPVPKTTPRLGAPSTLASAPKKAAAPPPARSATTTHARVNPPAELPVAKPFPVKPASAKSPASFFPSSTSTSTNRIASTSKNTAWPPTTKTTSSKPATEYPSKRIHQYAYQPPAPPAANPKPPQHQPQPPAQAQAPALDLSSFLEGSENWDLDINDDDLLSSPAKPAKVKSPVKSKPKHKPTSTSSALIPVQPESKGYVHDPCHRLSPRCVRDGMDSGFHVFLATITTTIDSSRNLYRSDFDDLSLSSSSNGAALGYEEKVLITDTFAGDVFNVIGTFCSIPSSSSSPDHPQRSITLTSQHNLLILHPDLLITATALSNAPQCRRKPILGMLLKVITSGSSVSVLKDLQGDEYDNAKAKGAKKDERGITPSLVWGNMLHEVVQRCLGAVEGGDILDDDDEWEKFVDARIEDAVRGGLGELVRLGGWEGYGGFGGGGERGEGKVAMTEEVARREVKARARGLGLFRKRYFGGLEEGLPKNEGTITDTRSSKGSARLAITRVLDVEEDIWSPRLGLKGKIDVTVEGLIQEVEDSPESGSSTALIPSPYPLELKTGRAAYSSLEHRAQTMLYTLLLSERYISSASAFAPSSSSDPSGSGSAPNKNAKSPPTSTMNKTYTKEVEDGLLFYTQSEEGEVVRVPRGRNEVRGLIGVRNELAAWVWKRVRKGKGRETVKEEVEEEEEASMDVDIEDMRAAGASAKTGAATNQAQEEEEGEEEPFLPPPIDNERECKRCYALDTCLLFRKTHPNHSSAAPALREVYDPPLPEWLVAPVLLGGAGASSNTTANTVATKTTKPSGGSVTQPPLKSLFDLKTGHLTPRHAAFFRKWERMLALEERDLVRYKRELWVLGAAERERRGRCWGRMRLVGAGGNDVDGEGDGEQEKWGKEGKIHRFRYSFKRPSGDSSNLLNGHMSVGDAVTVSVQGELRLLALARGFIVGLSRERVMLGVDHVLDVGEVRAKIGGGGGAKRDANGDGDGEVSFRIDKDELFGGMARVRSNLAQMFYADGDRKRLELVVDLRKPVFRDEDEDSDSDSKSMDVDVGSASASSTSSAPDSESDTTDLNPTQQLALRKALAAEDYALILGMPGTGKTTVIAALIKELVVKRGKTVLLTSYTHSAVDTILRKLDRVGVGVDEHESRQGADGRFKILRLGNVDKVHPEVRKYTVQGGGKQPETVDEMERQVLVPPVVATTCLSIDHPLFSRRTFDYCIVDEASQITLPTCLGPLRFADTFILVGDHYQLPPLVKNPEARALGLDVSLFKLLSEAHPEAVVDLRDQYRMNEEIMMLSNRLIYGERLRCGSEEVRKRVLSLPRREVLGEMHGERCWLKRLADESCKAVFVDTDLLPGARESRVGDLVQNVVEAELVSQFVGTLMKCGVKKSQVGVISLYRQQVKILDALLNGQLEEIQKKEEGEESVGGGDGGPVEIWTADKSQGRDKDCIVVSLVRSNEAGSVGNLLKDWRRINVSFTRARSKLVIFGSRKTLGREPLLQEFFDLMESKKWILQLEKGALEVHSRHGLIRPPEAVKEEMVEVEVKMEETEVKMEDVEDIPARTTTPEKRKLGKENVLVGSKRTLASKIAEKEKDVARPVKKMRLDAGVALLKGRPVLRDVVKHAETQ